MASKLRKPTAVERKLIGVADVVISAAQRRRDPTLAIPVRSLSNVSFNERKGHLEMGRRKMNARAYVARFNFQGQDQQKRVGELSGGERNRVHLAKLLRQGCNVLLLDEPTNDLDVDTLRALEEAILNFAGCVVVISHDRWFLDRIATHILAFEGDSYVHWCEGNFDTFMQTGRRSRK